MKKLTVKKQLVDMMIAAGNPGFKYTDVIKTVLKINFGRFYKYTRKDRGYYSCAISGINNYFMNGAGKCGLYKQDGKYYAKYFTSTERKMRAYNNLQRKIDYYEKRYSYFGYNSNEASERFTRAVARFTKNYERSLRMIEKDSY